MIQTTLASLVLAAVAAAVAADKRATTTDVTAYAFGQGIFDVPIFAESNG